MNPKFTQFLSLLVGLMVLSASALYAQPANNECSGAIDISALFDGNNNSSTLFDNTMATNVSDPTNGFECFGEATPIVENSLWFTFTGDGAAYTITTSDCGSTNYIADADAQIATYSGACGTLAPVANGCNEDGPGSGPGNWFSEVTIETVAGTTYYMLVDGFQASAGEFCLLVGPANFITGCEAGMMTNTGVVQVMGPDETFTIGVTGDVVPNTPTQGQYAWYFDNTNTNGSGGLGGAFWLNVGSGAEAMYNRDLNGILSNNGYPIMAGTWEVSGRVWADAGATQTTDPCSTTTDVLTVLFDEAPVITDCDAGILTTNGTVMVNDLNPTFTVTSTDRIIPNSPTQGGYTWNFIPGPDGTGALGGEFSFGIIASESSTYDDDLNGVLSANGFPPFSGTWYVKGQTSNDGTDVNTASNTVCDITTDSLTVIFALPDPVSACNAGVLTTTTPVDVPVGGTFTINVDNDTVPNMPTQGSYGYFLTPINGASGGLGGEFIIFANAGTNVYDNDLGGILSPDNPPLSGEWVFRGTVFGNVDDPFNSICSQTADSLIVNFEPQEFPCASGTFFSTETQIVCVGQQATVGLMNGTDSIPQGGGLGWLFDDSAGGTGGVAGGTILIDQPRIAAYNNDLGGILSANGLAPLQGPFILRSVVYNNSNDPVGTICSISTDSILVLFGDVVDLQIIEDGADLVAFVGPNFADYTYAWSTGETTMSITPTASGDFSVTATDGLGCETVAELMLVSTNEADIVNNLSVAPNPTSGLINVSLDLPSSKEVQLSVIDITGKEVMNLAPVTFSSRNFEVDIQNQASGLYLLRFRIGDDVVTRRVVKN